MTQLLFRNFFKGLGGLVIILGSLIAYPALWVFFKLRGWMSAKASDETQQ